MTTTTTITTTFRRIAGGYELTAADTGKGLGIIIADATDAEWAIRRLAGKLGSQFTVRAMPGALVGNRHFDHDAWAAMTL